MKPKVAVLIAGYNGHQFISEQVFSILWQKDVEVEIFIRVDGDNYNFRKTVSLLASRYPQIHYIVGNIVSTPASNFYNLILQNLPIQYDFYALCDQDDIWLPGKLSDSISYFKDDSPQGFSSGVTAYYKIGKTLPISLRKMRKYDFYFQSGGPGCTYVLNHSGYLFLKNFLLSNKHFLKFNAHDWLIYFTFRFHGFHWAFGNNSHILYRQHDSNVAGVNKGLIAKKKRFKLLFTGWYIDDLKTLIQFAKKNNNFPNFRNPFNLRRSYIESIIIWIYYWLYIHRRK